MGKLQPALAASLSVLVGLAAIIPAAEARGGGGHGGGGAAAHGSFQPGRGGEFGRGGAGYGVRPAAPNKYTRGVYPWVGIGVGDLYPPGYSYQDRRSPPPDCNYLFKKAVDSGSPEMWQMFNDCSHDR